MRSRLPLVGVAARTIPALERAGVDAEEGQRADERVGHDLEGQRGEGRVVGRPCASTRLLRVGIDALRPAGRRAATGR